MEGSLESWFSEKDIYMGRANWLKPVLWVSPIICLTLIALYGLGIITSMWPTIYFFAQLAWVGKDLKKVNRFHFGLSRKHEALERYASLLEHIDGEAFSNSTLVQTQAKSKQGAQAIRQLKRRMNLFGLSSKYDYGCNSEWCFSLGR